MQTCSADSGPNQGAVSNIRCARAACPDPGTASDWDTSVCRCSVTRFHIRTGSVGQRPDVCTVASLDAEDSGGVVSSGVVSSGVVSSGVVSGGIVSSETFLDSDRLHGGSQTQQKWRNGSCVPYFIHENKEPSLPAKNMRVCEWIYLRLRWFLRRSSR